MSQIIKNSETIQDYFTPAVETEIFYDAYSPTKKFKGIMNPESGKLLSVVTNRYKLIKNEELITKLLDTLEKVDCKYYIEPSHSFVSDKRMRLQLKFPELFLQDEESKIPFSLYVHNSYDGSEGVRIISGAIRAICSNGMVFGKVMQQFYHKHFMNVNVEEIKRSFEVTYKKFPEVQQRINALQRIEAWQVDHDMRDKLSKTFGKEFVEKEIVEPNPHLTAWQVYNLLTYHISHNISILQRAKYQQKVSRLFHI